ncbi:serine hydrolase domain-containing protein [Agrococcus baldri]|uniref:serine hydrolase domain-containing protein n=1 Tax=Agrococcus baldri TaxID=153730 RepID=UPI0011BE65EC|nr:serine hydrolase domain-containing protein [Agrococcus baldri]
MDTQQQPVAAPDAGIARRQARLVRLLERMQRARARKGRPAPTVLVESPRWRFAWGESERPMHAASCGKLVTAALIGQLVDEGRLGFETAIGSLLPDADTRGLRLPGGIDAAREVTVEHLLANRSGLPDYFEASAVSAASFRSAVAHPERRFSPADLLAAAATQRPVGRPGQRFHYGDTNWVLLGRIVEEASGDAFADRARTRVFDPLGMASASTPYDASRIADDLSGLDVAPFWILGREMSRAHAVSLDWAGGNVVATPADWARFLRGLFGGELLAPATLAQLTEARSRFRFGIDYGAGTQTLRWRTLAPFQRAPRPDPVGHLGFWAAHTFHYPGQRAQVVLNFHDHRSMQSSFLVHGAIARILASLD